MNPIVTSLAVAVSFLVAAANASVVNDQHYEHRLMGYNNDLKTTFADIQRVFDLLEKDIEKKLKEQSNK